MEEQIVIPTPLVTIEELPENMTSDTMEKHMMQVTQCKNKGPLQTRKEHLKKITTHRTPK